ncbi:hypothetical protein LIS04_42 [Listeria phage LIS04]|nr:hypothetical protein LIS04_42 [Listeria phage LIS04]
MEVLVLFTIVSESVFSSFLDSYSNKFGSLSTICYESKSPAVPEYTEMKHSGELVAFTSTISDTSKMYCLSNSVFDQLGGI